MSNTKQTKQTNEVVKTKMLYTKQELEALSEEDLLNLYTFGNEFSTHFYSNISSFVIEKGEYIAVMNDGTVLEFSNKEKYENTRTNKIRYELISQTLAGIQQDNDDKARFRADITASVAEQVKVIREGQVSVDANLRTITGNFQAAVTTSLSTLDGQMEDVMKQYNRKLSKFDKFNTESYEVKMQKVDKIIDAFEELLS